MCNKCHRLFPIERFFHQKKGVNGKIYYGTTCKDCDSIRLKKRYRSSIEKRMSCIFNAVRHRSTKKNIPFNLTEESMLEQYHKQNGLCYYTKEPLVLETGKKSISIDRIVSSKGYINGNVVFCQWIINNMKWDTDYNEFIERCGKIYDIAKVSKLPVSQTTNLTYGQASVNTPYEYKSPLLGAVQAPIPLG